MLIDTVHIDPCYAYRGQREDETAEDYGLRMADQLETEINRLGAENVLAFIAEPVVGATLGAVPAEKGYFQRIRDICDRHGVLLILDEVMCGMGRTGRFFATEADAINPISSPLPRGSAAAISRSGQCCAVRPSLIPSGTAPAFSSMVIPIWVTRLPVRPDLPSPASSPIRR